MNFQIGQVVWHLNLNRAVQIAGPLELFEEYQRMGETCNEPIRAHRIMTFEPRARTYIGQPQYLRPIDLTPSQWSLCHWQPKHLRSKP